MQKTFHFIIGLLLVITLLTACTNQKLPCEPQNAAMSVTISITGKDNETILSDYQVGIFDGNTVLDVLVYAAQKNNIQLDYTGLSKTAYVKGIDNLYEFDYGSASGWVYAINDPVNCPGESCGAYKLKDKDQIRWKYITERL
ncbi:DUF4430 domain-containing protein [Acetanaerobacterium elongatum]|uniref:Transcobalamin-like C-terminal domain-containing protein n=1 Tax=Acetanaerobacterium elongatum TaxID=258515 RepID=A0A1H0FLX3_9FIRM|nr:DUF4430 domain-containing protein [Acetanaerobacterium elongatum]SDN95469.1 protein of unknown function [Acetanaerobacterium elongatum]